MLVRFFVNFIKAIYRFICNGIRKIKNFLINLYYLNPGEVKADLIAEYNMTLKARDVKKQRRKLSLFYHLFVLFLFFSILMFYDMGDEDQYLFIYEFHKWW
jgi:hypothetical protein